MTKLFPNVLIGLMVLASLVYLYEGDWRKFIYFFAAAVLNASIVW